MHALQQRWISSGSSSVSSSSVVAVRSLTLQLQDIHIKQRRGTASWWQTLRLRHPRLHAASRNVKEQIETTLMAQLLAMLWYRLKLALSCQCYPWLKSRSKCAHFIKATAKWDQCFGGWKGGAAVVWGCCCSVALGNAFSTLSPPPGLPFDCTSSLSPSAQGLRPGVHAHSTHLQNHVDEIYSKACAKAFDVCGSETAFSFQTWENFLSFSPPMEMVMQAKKNVINNTNWGPLGGNFSFKKWLLCMNMSCHQKFICIVLTPHICIYFSSARHGPYPYLNRV